MLNKIQKEIFTRQGTGFTVQIDPDITVFQEYKETPSFWDTEKTVWKRKNLKDIYARRDWSNIGIEWGALVQQ